MAITNIIVRIRVKIKIWNLKKYHCQDYYINNKISPLGLWNIKYHY